jgi:hypothetical protein
VISLEEHPQGGKIRDLYVLRKVKRWRLW